MHYFGMSVYSYILAGMKSQGTGISPLPVPHAVSPAGVAPAVGPPPVLVLKQGPSSVPPPEQY